MKTDIQIIKERKAEKKDIILLYLSITFLISIIGFGTYLFFIR